MKQLKLRIPDELHAAIVARAATNERSLNGEIVASLHSAELISAFCRVVREEVEQALDERRPPRP